MKLIQRNTRGVLIGLLIVLGLLLWYPVRSEITRAAIPAVGAGCVVCAVVLLWRHRWLRWLPVMPLVTAAVFLAMPGRAVDSGRLTQAYLAALRQYEGTRYVWGGENGRGVDCSGLLRAAMFDAHVAEAVRTLNPALARHAAWLWWHDASAREMSNGYSGEMFRVGREAALAELDLNALEPGDLAVTEGGAHVLAYAGEGAWIEADPYVLRVIEIKPRSEVGEWNTAQVMPSRWRALYP